MCARAAVSSKQPIITDNRFAEAYKVLDLAIEAKAFPGCAFGVFAGGAVVLQDARGQFTYDEDSEFVTPSTVFDLASVSKVVATTAIAMLLYQSGQLSLDTPLGAILPAFVAGRVPGDLARTVTIRHLLAHSSGLPPYIEFFKQVTTKEQLLNACLKLPLEEPPGTRGYYSDPGFILLGKVLEVVGGVPMDVFAGRDIFEPLAMTSTTYCPKPEMWGAIPPTEVDTVFRHRRIQGEVQDENAWILGGVAGHAGLFSNVTDLLRFAREVLEAKSKEDRKNNLFQATTVETFGTRPGPADSSRALGWDTPSPDSSSGRFFSSRSIGHLGYSGCSLWIDRDAGIAVVLLTNRTWPDRKSQQIRQVRPAFHDAIRQAL
jgi:Beta-lactamase class C and other penicillin binding proteins